MTQKTASPATDEEIAEIKRRGLGLSIEDEERVFARIEEQKGQIADLGAQLAEALNLLRADLTRSLANLRKSGR